jgi:crotonobetainyl-CoA:carnitine CoA-transferase CaiB-like acyl-CoA transferase
MNSDTSLPLRGIRILDLTSVLMGPYASQSMGDLGADVIKVESLQGDTTRQIGPGRHPDMGGIFINSNRSKRGIAVDLKTDTGRDVMLRLARAADVFFYNIRPQAIARLGLSYEALRAVNPRIIYAGVFGYGQEGPYAAKPAYDDVIQGAATLSSLYARGTEGRPQYAPAAIADRITGLSAVNAILAALLERQHSGIGQKIDIRCSRQW